MKPLTVLIESRPFCVFDTAPLEKLEQTAGIHVINMRGSGIHDEKFVEALKETDAVLCGNDLLVNADLFAMAPNIRAVAKMGAGLDTVDVQAASRRGVIVFHTPGVNNQAVADHTFALILAVARKILYCDQSLREKRWEHTKVLGLEIWRKTLGLIGLGAIGRCVALRAKGFQMRVVAHDPFWPEEFAREHNIEKVGIDELLHLSDVVSIHSPLIPETKGMLDAKALRRMKPTAILVNAARGGIVVETDLYQALKDGVIAGAGIDVFEEEPPANSPLLELNNVVLTPHTAAFTREALNAMSAGVVDQLIDYVQGKRPAYTINPEVFQPWQGKTQTSSV